MFRLSSPFLVRNSSNLAATKIFATHCGQLVTPVPVIRRQTTTNDGLRSASKLAGSSIPRPPQGKGRQEQCPSSAVYSETEIPLTNYMDANDAAYIKCQQSSRRDGHPTCTFSLSSLSPLLSLSSLLFLFFSLLSSLSSLLFSSLSLLSLTLPVCF